MTSRRQVYVLRLIVLPARRLRKALVLGVLAVGISTAAPSPGFTQEPVPGPDSAQQAFSPPVTVHLASGRKFTALVDPRSDGDRLWLRFQSDGTKLLRPIDWDRVVRVEASGQDVTAEEFKGQLSQYIAGEFDIFAKDAVRRPAEINGIPWQPNHPRDRQAPFAEHVLGMAPRAAAIRADVDAGQWDGDVEADGLVVLLSAISERGLPAPAAGTLTVTLFAQRDGRDAFRELGRWSENVSVEDYAFGPAVIRLPFQAVHPDFDLKVASHGIVHVSLSSPGSGVLESTDSFVRLREFSPLRDALQRDTQGRFLPYEQTGRGK